MLITTTQPLLPLTNIPAATMDEHRRKKRRAASPPPRVLSGTHTHSHIVTPLHLVCTPSHSPFTHSRALALPLSHPLFLRSHHYSFLSLSVLRRVSLRSFVPVPPDSMVRRWRNHHSNKATTRTITNGRAGITNTRGQ